MEISDQQNLNEAFRTESKGFVNVQDFDSFGARKASQTAVGKRDKSNSRLKQVESRGVTSAGGATSSQAPQSVNIIAKKRPPPLNIGYNELGVKTKRAVLYRNFHEISGRVYLIEISRDKKKVFILLFENFE